MRTLRRILMVEDDSDIATLAQIGLEEVGGFDVRHVADPRSTLDALHDFAPDLLLLDYRMPHLDGTEVYQAVRLDPAFGSLPVIFMTANVMQRNLATLDTLGTLGVISKPFDPLTLSDQVRRLWGAADS